MPDLALHNDTKAVSVPFCRCGGYRDSQNVAKVKEKDARGHREGTRIPFRTCLSISGDTTMVVEAMITYFVFLGMGIFVDLPLCGIII
jgi:hypothetical protein